MVADGQEQPSTALRWAAVAVVVASAGLAFGLLAYFDRPPSAPLVATMAPDVAPGLASVTATGVGASPSWSGGGFSGYSAAPFHAVPFVPLEPAGRGQRLVLPSPATSEDGRRVTAPVPLPEPAASPAPTLPVPAASVASAVPALPPVEETPAETTPVDVPAEAPPVVSGTEERKMDATPLEAGPAAVEVPLPPQAVPVPAGRQGPDEPAASQVAAGDPAVAVAASQPPLDPAALIARGDEFLAQSDAVSARLFFRRAADNGSGAGALAMGGSFDPLVLRQRGVRGVRPDAGTALQWYRRATELGATEGQARSARLLDELRRQAAQGDEEAQAVLRAAGR